MTHTSGNQWSDAALTWREVANGDWPDSDLPNRVWLSKPEHTRFIRLEALSTAGDGENTSVAEFDVIAP